MADHEVTLQDFMYPEFRGKDPKDYEFRRGDGKIVRKDRWEKGMYSIAFAITGDGRTSFEIDNLIKTVEWLLDQIPDREMPEETNEEYGETMGEIVLTTRQILNLCEFAGIAIDMENSCFYLPQERYLLDTEFAIAQNNHGAVSYLYEYPEEGGYPLSGDPHVIVHEERTAMEILKEMNQC